MNISYWAFTYDFDRSSFSSSLPDSWKTSESFFIVLFLSEMSNVAKWRMRFRYFCNFFLSTGVLNVSKKFCSFIFDIIFSLWFTLRVYLLRDFLDRNYFFTKIFLFVLTYVTTISLTLLFFSLYSFRTDCTVLDIY